MMLEGKTKDARNSIRHHRDDGVRVNKRQMANRKPRNGEVRQTCSYHNGFLHRLSGSKKVIDDETILSVKMLPVADIMKYSNHHC